MFMHGTTFFSLSKRLRFSLFFSLETERALRNWISVIVQQSNRSAFDPVSVFSDFIQTDSAGQYEVNTTNPK